MDLTPPIIGEDRSEEAEVLLDILVRYGMPSAQARKDAAESPFAGPLDQIAEQVARYTEAGAEQVAFNWPAPYDSETLDALASLR